MYGMDLSHYQNAIDLSKAADKYQFCIIKATEGIGFKDKSFNKFAIELTVLNKLIGCYHYARPDYHGTVSQIKAEANYFIKEVEEAGLLGKAILVLDWEKAPFDNEELITAWLKQVEDSTGIKPFIYGSRSKLTQWAKYNFMLNYPIWLAQYPKNDEIDIGYMPLSPPSFKFDYKIWQYTSSGKYPNFKGNIDLDWTSMSWEEWILLCKSITNNLSPAMQWCIDNGIFVGDGKGNYYPDRPLTRNEAAIVLQKLYNLIKEQ